MADEKLRLMIIGAHPDDAEVMTCALMCEYRNAGHDVHVISVTNGDAGHYATFGDELAAIREKELRDSCGVIGATVDVWGNHDGELVVTLEVRRQVIKAIREYGPDLVVTHRVCDYHPDHRAVGQLVQDASYMCTVPGVVRDVTPLKRDPVIAFMYDGFTRPVQLAGDVVIDADEHAGVFAKMVDHHYSQMYEWLAYQGDIKDSIPSDEDERMDWLVEHYYARREAIAERFRAELIDTYGKKRGKAIRFAEAYEVSEYARKLDEAEWKRLFWFLPQL